MVPIQKSNGALEDSSSANYLFVTAGLLLKAAAQVNFALPLGWFRTRSLAPDAKALGVHLTGTTSDRLYLSVFDCSTSPMCLKTPGTTRRSPNRTPRRRRRFGCNAGRLTYKLLAEQAPFGQGVQFVICNLSFVIAPGFPDPRRETQMFLELIRQMIGGVEAEDFGDLFD